MFFFWIEHKQSLSTYKIEPSPFSYRCFFCTTGPPSFNFFRKLEFSVSHYHRILEELNFPPAVYGRVIEDDFYISCVEIKHFPRDEDSVAYWGLH
ncbi:hypothetical protein LguiA_027445 [Lonicera macranthoides]